MPEVRAHARAYAAGTCWGGSPGTRVSIDRFSRGRRSGLQLPADYCINNQHLFIQPGQSRPCRESLMNIDDVLMQRTDVWRGGSTSPSAGLASGYPALDQLLNGGWPQGALVEILSAQRGIGELQLLLPLLARITREPRWLALVTPPYLPYAPALVQAGVQLAHVLLIRPREHADSLWAVEQTLRSGHCGAVLAWLPRADGKQLRRLQLAAETGASTGFLFRNSSAAQASSPAAVRLQLRAVSAADAHLHIQVLKRRNGWPVGPLALQIGPLAKSQIERPDKARSPMNGCGRRGVFP